MRREAFYIVKIKKSLGYLEADLREKEGQSSQQTLMETGEKDSVTSHHISFNFCYFHVGLLNE